MRLKNLTFIIILIISGELYAEEKSCGFPHVENGRIAQYYYTFKNFYFPMSIDKKLSFFCLAGYTTESGRQEERTTCTTEGWSPEPRCFKKCTKPDLSNGYISDVKLLYKIQENMHYGCASGYKTTGGKDEEVVQCLSDGWSSQPTCRKEHETCLAPELYNGNYSTTQKTFKVKDKVQYECATGYYTAGGKKTEEVECLTYGWSLTPKCTKLKCSSLRFIENGYFHPVKQTYEEGDVIQFFCHENYYLSGSDLIQCYNFGWYPESPVCEGRRNRCPPPPLPINSKIQTHSTTYRHGEVVHIECELNFVIHGSEEIRCENGKWTEPPKCIEGQERVACEEPPFIENGAANLHSKIYYNGDKVTYACKSGYLLRGLKNNENCKHPPVVMNGAVADGLLASYAAGSSVEYRCNEYYLLRGSKISRCEQGKWSSPPVCLEPCTVNVDYMNRNNIEMKWKYEGKVLHGDLIDFVCKQGYDLPPLIPLSELSVQCNRGEVKYPLCTRKEPCTLSFAEMEKNNLLLKWDFDNRPHILHGEYVEFICRGDTYPAELYITGSILRMQCDRGQLKYPRCIPRQRTLSYQEPLRT
uniref:Sushi domain-containing protein n=1 Tax=Colobus angolensis palliatus TaxID=336983 RepID=A0A2K5IAX4_COLAP